MFVCRQFGIDTDRPMICQVSRFDPWKDPLGVIDAYRIVKAERPEVQLALVGSMASDDPEGWDFYNSTLAHADGDPDIHILNNFNNVGSIEVNAFQSLSDVVIQKSTREGFGLTVSEALWKGRPFIGGNVGGHPAAGRERRDRLPGRHRRGVRGADRRRARRSGAGPVARPARQGARARAFPHAPLPARLPEDLPRGAVMSCLPAPGPRLQPRTGDLRGRRLGQARHRRPRDRADRPRLPPRRDLDRLGDDRRRRRAVASEHGGRPFEVEAPEGGTYHVRFVASDPEAYDRFYNIFANPMLWFIQHYLWDQSNAPDIRRHEVDAFENGYQVVNRDLAEAVLEEIDGSGRAGRDGPRLPALHAAGDGPRRAAGRLPAPLRAHPVDAVGRVARAAGRHPRRDLPRAAGQRHHRLPHALVPAQLPAVLPRPAGPRGRHGARRRHVRRPRGLGARLSAADRLRGDAGGRAARRGGAVRGGDAARGGASTRSCGSTAPTCRRTSCAGSRRSTSSSSSTRSSPSGSPSRRS